MNLNGIELVILIKLFGFQHWTYVLSGTGVCNKLTLYSELCYFNLWFQNFTEIHFCPTNRTPKLCWERLSSYYKKWLGYHRADRDVCFKLSSLELPFKSSGGKMHSKVKSIPTKSHFVFSVCLVLFFPLGLVKRYNKDFSISVGLSQILLGFIHLSCTVYVYKAQLILLTHNSHTALILFF